MSWRKSLCFLSLALSASAYVHSPGKAFHRIQKSFHPHLAFTDKSHGWGPMLERTVHQAQDNIYLQFRDVQGKSIHDLFARAALQMRVWLWNVDEMIQKKIAESDIKQSLQQSIDKMQDSVFLHVQHVDGSSFHEALFSSAIQMKAWLWGIDDEIQKELAKYFKPFHTRSVSLDASTIDDPVHEEVPLLPVVELKVSVINEPNTPIEPSAPAPKETLRAQIGDAKSTPVPLRPPVLIVLPDTESTDPVSSATSAVLKSLTSLFSPSPPPASQTSEDTPTSVGRDPIAVKYLEPFEREAIEEYRKAVEIAKGSQDTKVELEEQLVSFSGDVASVEGSLDASSVVDQLEEGVSCSVADPLLSGTWEKLPIVIRNDFQPNKLKSILRKALIKSDQSCQSIDTNLQQVTKSWKGRLLHILPLHVQSEGVLVPSNESTTSNTLVIRFSQPTVRVGPLVLRVRTFAREQIVAQRLTYLSDKILLLKENACTFAFKRQTDVALVGSVQLSRKTVWDMIPQTWKRASRA